MELGKEGIIEELPEEILLYIMQYLNFKDYISCMRVNRKFRDTAMMDFEKRVIEFLLEPIQLHLENPLMDMLSINKNKERKKTTNRLSIYAMIIILDIMKILFSKFTIEK